MLGGMALVVYANWLMLGYSPGDGLAAGGRDRPAPGRRSRPVDSGARQGARSARSIQNSARKAARSSICHASMAARSASRSSRYFFYDNTQAVHLALAKDLAPYRTAAHVAGSMAKPGLAALNGMITQQAAVIAVIDQFKILMFAMLIVSPLVLFLRKPRPAS